MLTLCQPVCAFDPYWRQRLLFLAVAALFKNQIPRPPRAEIRRDEIKRPLESYRLDATIEDFSLYRLNEPAVAGTR